MPRVARPTLLTLLAVAATARAAPATTRSTTPADRDSINKLIDRLGSAEPEDRRAAADALAEIGTPAAAALRVAAHSPRPAVAEAAAALLLKGRWYAPEDAASVRLVLSGYGVVPPARRVEILQMIIGNRLPDYLRVVIRVTSRDPSDEVGWGVYQSMPVDAEAERAMSVLDADLRPPAMNVLLAQAMNERNDPDALPLIRRTIERERQRPTAPPAGFAWATDVLVDAETRQGHAAEAAAGLRDQIARADDPAGHVALVDRLLDLHARLGPLPGVADDLKNADAQPESHAPFAVALMAERAGLPTGGGALLAAALRERPEETEVDRAARLSDTAEWLRAAGHADAACRVFDRIAAAESEPVRGRVLWAYLKLSELHAAAGRPALAGDALQRAITRQDGPLLIKRNGLDEPWPVEDEQARVYWYYLLDAQARGDAAAVTKMARDILASGSTDGGQFLDVLPTLAAAASHAEVDAYFDRAFDRAKAAADAAPDRPVNWNDLAWLCARAGRKLPEAATWAERAVKARPDESAFLDTLAEVKFRTGKIKDAIDLETKALTHQPDDEAFMRTQLARFRQAATTRPKD